ncbi:hypothetical protein PENTCL1PPCAC_13547, partial [Pristionchus entomophagus]
EFELSTLESLLEYAYSGKLQIEERNIQDLMIGANFLYIETVMLECAQFMRRRIRVENVLSLLIFCKSIAYKEIDQFLLRFIDKNVIPISFTSEFHELSIDLLVR